jgi:DNA polymerase-3 subunit beta
MKIECNKNKLLKAVSKAEKIVSKNPSLPVLSCVVLEAEGSKLTIKATNLEIGIKVTIPAEVSVSGEIAIPSNILFSYLNNLSIDESLLIEVKDNTTFVSGSKSETKINIVPVDDFPVISDTSDVKSCKLPSTELVDGFKGVWYAASASSMRPELSSVYIYPDGDKLFFVATDSFRLAEKKVVVQTDNFESILIPQRNVHEIVRIFDDHDADLKVNFEEDKVSFEADDIFVVSRVIDGNFPDYKQIIPKDSNTEVTVLKNDLQNSLKISNLFSNNFNQTSFIVDDKNNTLEVLSKNPEKGETRNTISSTVRGEALEINFNQKYINDCFNSIKSENLILNFNGSGKPMVIKGVNDNSFRYLVMPLNK